MVAVRWLRWLALACLVAAPVGAVKPVKTVWTDVAGKQRLVIVSPESLVDLHATTDLLPKLSWRPVTPEAYGPATLQRGEFVLFLVDRAKLNRWPAALTASWKTTFELDLAAVPANHVVAAYRDKPVWQFVITAPNAAQLRRAVTELLEADAQLCLDHPRPMVAYQLERALGIGLDRARLVTWLHGQETSGRKYEVWYGRPEKMTTEAIDASTTIACELTFDVWRKLPPAQQAMLTPLLPPAARQLLAGPRDALVYTGCTTTPTRRVAVALAPDDRFLAAALPNPARPRSPLPNALATFGSPGGTHELKDLRRLRKAILSTGVDNADRALAADLALKLRGKLRDECGFEFLDDRILRQSVDRWVATSVTGGTPPPDVAGAGVDTIMVVHVLHVDRRTEYAEGEPRQITPEPDKFDENEPDEPHGDDQKGFFGGHKYPLRDKDPQYLKDHAKWRDDHADWERHKREWEEGYRRATVEWELTEITHRAATVEGQLDLFDRDGKLIEQRPLRGGAADQSERAIRVNTRGFGHRPPSMLLPESRAEAPEALVSAAVVGAAQGLDELRLAALTPKDAGTLPEPPKATAPSELMETVEVVGDAALGADLEAARRQARAAACRAAVERVCGAYVDARTRVKDGELIEDSILSRADGFAAVKEVVKEEQTGKRLVLTCRVEVRNKPLREKLVAAGVMRWKVMVVVPEQHLGRDVPTPAVEPTLIQRLQAAGLTVVDKDQAEALRRDRAALAQVQGHKDLARKLAAQYDARVLLTGSAYTQDVTPQYGRPTCQAEVELKLIDLNTGEVLCAEGQTAQDSDLAPASAGQAALRKAARGVSETVIDRIFRVAGNVAETVRLTLDGFGNLTEVEAMRKLLERCPSVQAVRRLPFVAPRAEFELDIDQGTAGDLGLWLEQQQTEEMTASISGEPTPTRLEGTVRWPKREAAAKAAAEAKQRAEEERKRREAEAAAKARADAEAARRAGLVAAASRQPALLDVPAVKLPTAALAPLRPLLAWYSLTWRYDEAAGKPVPVEQVTRSMDPETHAVTYTVQRPEGARTISVAAGRKLAQLDGKSLMLPVAPMELDDVLYVPLRFLAEALNLDLKLLSAAEATAQLGAPVPGVEAFRLTDGERTGFLAVKAGG